MNAAERTVFAAIQDHATVCARCRDGDDHCPEAAALYRAWRPALHLALRPPADPAGPPISAHSQRAATERRRPS